MISPFIFNFRLLDTGKAHAFLKKKSFCLANTASPASCHSSSLDTLLLLKLFTRLSTSYDLSQKRPWGFQIAL